jgi:hypothetical protein
MSYTEYLRRKAAAEPVILNTKKFEDASMFTQKQKFKASQVFRLNGADIGTTIEANDRSGNAHRPMSYQKQTGRPADASDYTAYLGYLGVRDDAAYERGRITQACSGCAPSVNFEVYSGSGVRRPNMATTQASQVTRTIEACPSRRANGAADPISNQVFVDTTIRLSAGVPDMVVENANTKCCVPAAIHPTPQNPKEVKAYPQTPNRPSQAGGQYALIGPNITSPDDARKVGAAVMSYYPPYVEKHHGNDLNVNPKRPFVKYKPGGLPAQLKINEPTHYPVA